MKKFSASGAKASRIGLENLERVGIERESRRRRKRPRSRKELNSKRNRG